MYGRLEMTSFLLDKGLNPRAKAQGHDWTPLQALASWTDNPEDAELLISHGADVNEARDDDR
jgi:hypothetical protein